MLLIQTLSNITIIFLILKYTFVSSQDNFMPQIGTFIHIHRIYSDREDNHIKSLHGDYSPIEQIVKKDETGISFRLGLTGLHHYILLHLMLLM